MRFVLGKRLNAPETVNEDGGPFKWVLVWRCKDREQRKHYLGKGYDRPLAPNNP